MLTFWTLAVLALVCTGCGANLADTDEDAARDSKVYTKDATPQQEKRQLPSFTIPVYYDAATAPVQPQPQQGFLPNFPIIGTLVGNIPGLGGQQGGLFGPGGLGSGLNGLLGNFGFGQSGQSSVSNAASCPLAQKLTCRCEPLVPIKPTGARSSQALEVVAQNSKQNEDGTRELVAELSNNLIIYQKDSAPSNAAEQTSQGFFSLKLAEQKYLTIRYTVSDIDYTVKADVSAGPPSSE